MAAKMDSAQRSDCIGYMRPLRRLSVSQGGVSGPAKAAMRSARGKRFQAISNLSAALRESTHTHPSNMRGGLARVNRAPLPATCCA